MEPEIRDGVVEKIMELKERTGKGVKELIGYIGLARSKYYNWAVRYGIGSNHNGKVPKSHWLEEEEKEKIREYGRKNYGEGYRRLAYKMIDEDIAYASPSSVYRVLKGAGLLVIGFKVKVKRKGKGYRQPLGPHEEWHIDISWIKVGKLWLFLIAVIDGFSRYIVAWDLRASVEEKDIEIVLEKGREKFPNAKPRIISDRGSQFIAREFKEYIMEVGFKHTLITVGYPQANGKAERFFRTAKEECVLRNSFFETGDAKEKLGEYIEYYNDKRLHSSIGYISPKDMLDGRKDKICRERERKLDETRKKRIVVYNRLKEKGKVDELDGISSN